MTTAVALANAVCLMGQPIGLITNGRDAADRIRLRDEVTQALNEPWANRAAMHERAAMLREGRPAPSADRAAGPGAEGFSGFARSWPASS